MTKTGQSDSSFVILALMVVVAFFIYILIDQINLPWLLGFLKDNWIILSAAAIILATVWLYVYMKFFRQTFRD